MIIKSQIVFLTLIMFLFSSQFVGNYVSYSQNVSVEWTKNYGSNYEDVFRYFQIVNNDAFVICGSTSSFGSGKSDAWLILTNLDGIPTWQKYYGGSENDGFNCIQIDDEGSFILCGSTSSFGAGGSDGWLVKINVNGDVLWQYTFGGSGNDKFNHVQKTSDGGYILCGSTYSFGTGYGDAWLLKTNSNGEIVWQKTYYESAENKLNELSCVIQTLNNNFVISGFGYGYYSDSWIIKTDLDGNLIWKKAYGWLKEDYAKIVLETHDGDYLFCGEDNYWPSLKKIETNGNVIFDKKYAVEQYGSFHHISKTKIGGFILCGDDSYSGDALIIKTTNLGNQVWRYSLDGKTYCIQELDSKSYIICGSIESSGSGNSDGLLIKIKEAEEIDSFIKISNNYLVNDEQASVSCAWIDINSDNLLDLFVVNKDEVNNLFSNNGNGLFKKIETGSIITEVSKSFGQTWGDFNNDGNIDVFISNNNDENNVLYKNVGNERFEKITNQIVVEDGGKSIAACWGDYNNDGFIDLIVANDQDQNNFLYRNNGNGTFDKISEGIIVNDAGYSTSCCWVDINDDGYLDLFVTNWQQNNCLYMNNGNETFSKITEGQIVNDGGYSFGSSWGDYNNDGLFDVFVCNCGEESFLDGENNFLYQNQENNSFIKITNGEIVSDGGFSFGSCWSDFDNDGDLDLFVSNKNDQNNFFYINNLGNFSKEANSIIVNDGGQSFGTAHGDFDNDGYLDFFVSNRNQENYLYENIGNKNNWIQIKLVGNVSNKAGIGAKIRMKAPIKNQATWQFKQILAQSGGGYGGQNSTLVEFGVGNAKIIDSLIVEWPSGIVDKYSNIQVNSLLTLMEGEKIIPVELSLFNFEIINNVIYIYWTTVSESNNYGFEIQRKKDNNEFHTVQFIRGNGTSLENHKYSYYDQVELPGMYSYRLKQIDFDGSFEYSEILTVPLETNLQFSLNQNYPNPFNPTTQIKFSIPKKERVIISIYNLLGSKLKTLVDDVMSTGIHKIDFNPQNLPSGIYIYKLEAGERTTVKKMIYMK